MLRRGVAISVPPCAGASSRLSLLTVQKTGCGTLRATTNGRLVRSKCERQNRSLGDISKPKVALNGRGDPPERLLAPCDIENESIRFFAKSRFPNSPFSRT